MTGPRAQLGGGGDRACGGGGEGPVELPASSGLVGVVGVVSEGGRVRR